MNWNTEGHKIFLQLINLPNSSRILFCEILPMRGRTYVILSWLFPSTSDVVFRACACWASIALLSKWVNAQTRFVQREEAAVQTHIYLHIVHHSITCAGYTTVCTLLPVLSFPYKTSSVQLHKDWFDVTSRPGVDLWEKVKRY